MYEGPNTIYQNKKKNHNHKLIVFWRVSPRVGYYVIGNRCTHDRKTEL